jgi:hypothetical protein
MVESMISINLDQLLVHAQEMDLKFSLAEIDSIVMHPSAYVRLFADIPKKYCRLPEIGIGSVKVVTNRYLPEKKIWCFDRKGEIISVLEID